MPVTLSFALAVAVAVSCVPTLTPVAMTIGIVLVAWIAAAAAGVPAVTMTSIPERTNSSAALANRA